MTAALADAHCGAAACGGNTVPGSHIRAPIGSRLAFTTELVGIVGDLPAAGVQGTGISFTWTSTFNGTNGGIAVTNVDQPVDPGSGSGGVTITSFRDTNTYHYNGVKRWLVRGNGSVTNVED